jgi:hypothetical protein
MLTNTNTLGLFEEHLLEELPSCMSMRAGLRRRRNPECFTGIVKRAISVLTSCISTAQNLLHSAWRREVGVGTVGVAAPWSISLHAPVMEL